MSKDLQMTCICGKWKAIARNIDPKKGSHVTCTCNSCQKYLKVLDREDLLDKHGGTTIFQTAPQNIEFQTGQDQLKCLKLSPNSLLRWHTGCCKTPVANTVRNAKVPFVGIPIIAFGYNSADEGIATLGPVRETVWALHAKNGRPPNAQDKASFGFMLRSLRLLLQSAFTNRGKPSPFFDEKGSPICEPSLAPR